MSEIAHSQNVEDAVDSWALPFAHEQLARLAAQSNQCGLHSDRSERNAFHLHDF